MQTICKEPSAYLPTVAVETLPVEAVSSTTDVTRMTNLVFEQRTYEAGYDDFQINVTPANFGDTWTLTNDHPAVCDLDENGLATRISSGTARISITNGNHKQYRYLSFTDSESITYVWKGYTGTTVGSILANNIKSMMVAGGDFCIFSNYTQSDTTATLNPNRWFTPDISASGLATTIFGGWSTANSGVLIADRVFIGVAHWTGAPYNMTPGVQIKFVNATGTVYTRTILSRYQPPGYDLFLCILDDVAMPGITPMAIVGNWFVELLANNQHRLHGMGFQVHQDKRVTPCVFDPIVNGGTFPTAYDHNGKVRSFGWLKRVSTFTDPENWLYGFDEFWALDGVVNYGDSGGLIGVVVDGNPVVVSMFTGPETGYLYYEGIEDDMNAWIQLAADAAEVVISDTVSIAPDPTL